MQQSRKQTAMYGVVFIILVGFLAFAVMSSRHSKPASHPGTAKLLESGNRESTESSSDEPGVPAPQSTTSNSTASNGTSASSSTKQLAATGPTETVTLFVAAVATGTAVAHMRQRRASVLK